MKAILEFNLPEDEEQFNTASKGMDWALVVWAGVFGSSRYIKFINYREPKHSEYG